MPPEGEVGTRYREFLTKMCGKLKKWDDTRLYIGNTGYGLGNQVIFMMYIGIGDGITTLS